MRIAFGARVRETLESSLRVPSELKEFRADGQEHRPGELNETLRVCTPCKVTASRFRCNYVRYISSLSVIIWLSKKDDSSRGRGRSPRARISLARRSTRIARITVRRFLTHRERIGRFRSLYPASLPCRFRPTILSCHRLLVFAYSGRVQVKVNLEGGRVSTK